MNFLATVILLSITFPLYVYWRFKKSREFFDTNSIPYLKPTILVGNIGDALFKRKPIPIIHLEIYRTLEPHKFGGFFNFHTPIIMIRDPELIKHIMIKDFDHFYDRSRKVNTEMDRLSENLAAMRGEEWRNLRIKLTSTFTAAKMKLMFPLVKECSDKLVRTLNTMLEKPFDAKDLCARYSTDVIGICIFGIETHSLDDPNSEFRKIGDRIFQFRYEELVMSAFPDLPKILMKFFNLRFVDTQIKDFFTTIVKNTVKYREENKIFRHDFFDLLLSMKNETMQTSNNQDHRETELDHLPPQAKNDKSNNKIEMTIDSMVAQCSVFFAAGFESVSAALGFLLLELAIHQDIQNKLRIEINSVINNNPEELTYEVLKKMPYVEMTFTEVLRKYPGTAFAIRHCTKDYKLPNTTNVIIPKNTPIIIPILGLHRDPKYYEKPDEFYPEHFTEEAKANRPNYTYLPFGEGPRACLGERFAKMVAKIGLISLLRNFSFELSPKTVHPVRLQRHFKVLRSEGGVWLQCKKI